MGNPDTTPPPPASPAKLTLAERNALQMSVLILAELCETEAKTASDLKQPDIARDWLAQKKSIETELPGLIDTLDAASKDQCEKLSAGLGLFFKRLRGAAGTMRGIGHRDTAVQLDAELEDLKASLPPKLGEQKSLDLSPRKQPPEPTAGEDQPHTERKGRGKGKGKEPGSGVLDFDSAQRMRAAVERDLKGETPTVDDKKPDDRALDE